MASIIIYDCGWEGCFSGSLDYHPPGCILIMYICYLDDSGSAPNPREQHLVLGGISVYERHTYWFTQQLDNLASQIDPDAPNSVEFHASEIFSGRVPPWDKFRREERIEVIKQVLGIIRNL